MKSIYLASVATALLAAAPASSAIMFAAGNVPGSLDTVHLDGISPTNSKLVLGDVNGVYAVNILGTEDITPSSDGFGQPWVAALDGTLNSLTFSLASGFTFGAIEFNLNPPKTTGKPVDYLVTLDAISPDGVVTPQSFSVSGNNFFNAWGTDGWTLKSVTFTTANDLAGVGQIRIGGIAATPEPATWAMMVGGFGLIGFALRRRRDTRLTFA